MGKTKTNNKCLRIALLLITMLMAQTTWANTTALAASGDPAWTLEKAKWGSTSGVQNCSLKDLNNPSGNATYWHQITPDDEGLKTNIYAAATNNTNASQYLYLGFYHPLTIPAGKRQKITYTFKVSHRHTHYYYSELLFEMFWFGKELGQKDENITFDNAFDRGKVNSSPEYNKWTDYVITSNPGGQFSNWVNKTKSISVYYDNSNGASDLRIDDHWGFYCHVDNRKQKQSHEFALQCTGIKVENAEICGDGTAQSPCELNNAKDLDVFCKQVNGGNQSLYAKMMNDIDFSAYGSSVINEYKGTFDGNGHTLTINIDRTEEFAGPFYNLYGTVENLTVAGTIKTSKKFAGGIASQTKSGAVIRGCISSVKIESSLKGDGTHGGFIGCEEGASTIDNCVFSGSINGENVYKCAGFVGWCKTSTTITNSWMIGDLNIHSTAEDNGNGNATFARNPGKFTLKNCYYKDHIGGKVEGATQITGEQLASGEVCYKLNDNQSNDVRWYQSIGTDNRPRLEGDHSEQSIVKHYMLNGRDFYMSENGTTDFLSIEDKHGYDIDIPFTTRAANYQREMSSTWGTISLPFSMNYNAENPVYRLYYLSEVNNNTLTFVAFGSGEVEAGTPMLIKRIDANPYIKISSEMAQVTPASQMVDCDETGWKMKGGFSNGRFYPDKGVDVYCISKNQFWLVNSEVNMPAFRAYFIAPSNQGAAAVRTFDIVEETGQETAVHIVEDNQENSVQLQFDLNGRISNRNAGLRIVNGKCVMFK